jgi:hypothetical protein
MTQIPDLLRRFAVTPQRTVVTSGKKSIAIESNDRETTVHIAKFIAAHMELDAVQKIHLVRIVRDGDVTSDGTNLSCVHCGPVVALLRGSTTSFYLDVALGELLGFLATDVDFNELTQRLLPAILCGSIPTESTLSGGDDKRVTSAASARDNLSALPN